jgi:hypothetical protein
VHVFQRLMCRDRQAQLPNTEQHEKQAASTLPPARPPTTQHRPPPQHISPVSNVFEIKHQRGFELLKHGSELLIYGSELLKLLV